MYAVMEYFQINITVNLFPPQFDRYYGKLITNVRFRICFAMYQDH